jgi:aminopeptidase N
MSRYIFFISIILLTATGCKQSTRVAVEKGVSIELAQYRKANISELKYELHFIIPENSESDIIGKEEIIFSLKRNRENIQIDFRESQDKISSVKCNGKPTSFTFENEHLIIPSDDLLNGQNSIEIEFIAGNTSLNRNEEFLYTLLVPDRARTVFPCFDQPDLKAEFSLKLDIPNNWEAAANGKMVEQKEFDSFKRIEFAPTKPIPTYLFSFAAGVFQTVTKEHNGRSHTLYHRETDMVKFNKNIDDIFSLLFHSLDWLEDYTGIDYPFNKYDFIAIPSFQYSGMEHTGATLYNSRSLFLDENASQNKILKRASLIAHETAHMWFGDLVTMKWFDQVWLKEVFANYMTGKIINQNYPELNHDLMFALAHLPPAYNIDRTNGANSVNQKLNNLKNAGTLYGSIIYHKSPVVMRMLGQIIGEEALQKGLQKYLLTYSYSNATWEDLIAILNTETEPDLKEWSHIWVDEPNRPRIFTTISSGADGTVDKLIVYQEDNYGKNRAWTQNFNLIFGYKNHIEEIPVNLTEKKSVIKEATGKAMPDFVAINDKGYGYYLFDEKSKSYLLENISNINDELTRGICWINLWENLMEGNIEGKDFMEATLVNLPNESNILNFEKILSYLSETYWIYLSDIERAECAAVTEDMLWNIIKQTDNKQLKASCFSALSGVATSKRVIDEIYGIWNGELKIDGLNLSESQLSALAQQLALKIESKSDYILETQLNRISNPDMKDRFKFIMPALSPDTLVRDNFFNNLRNPKNRENERWVNSSLAILHHPSRVSHSVKYIHPSLELLKEIQETGDIFFPFNWLKGTYSGHNSKKAKTITEEFLANNPNYPENLKMKILQSADRVLRIK